MPVDPNKVRDHLANERTFLAWVRTSISLLAFGVVIAKLRFLLGNLPADEISVGIPAAGEGGRSLLLGLMFCLVGIATLIFAVVSYTRNRRNIDSNTYESAGNSLIGFVVVVAILAVASVVFLVNL